jgi:hypothetical protein
MPYTTMSNYTWLFDLPMDCAITQPTKPSAFPESNSSQARDTLHDNGVVKDGADLPPASNTAFRYTADAQIVQHPTRTLRFPETSLLTAIPSPAMPLLDELSHDRILAFVEQSDPVLPDGTLITAAHPLLSLQSLQKCLDLFFTRFNISYPLIHQATFECSSIDTLLLMSIIILGATYGDKDIHQLAVCIHDVLRPHIFANPAFNVRPQLWVLQAILLVECFGKSRAGRKQHDMSHLFHGLLINLIRRSDCQTVQPEASLSHMDGIDSQWRKWVELEQQKR